jgi:hypothetical protein
VTVGFDEDAYARSANVQRLAGLVKSLFSNAATDAASVSAMFPGDDETTKQLREAYVQAGQVLEAFHQALAAAAEAQGDKLRQAIGVLDKVDQDSGGLAHFFEDHSSGTSTTHT